MNPQEVVRIECQLKKSEWMDIIHLLGDQWSEYDDWSDAEIAAVKALHKQLSEAMRLE